MIIPLYTQHISNDLYQHTISSHQHNFETTNIEPCNKCHKLQDLLKFKENHTPNDPTHYTNMTHKQNIQAR